MKEKLKKFSFFNEVEDNRLDELCENAKIITLPADSILFKKGEPCHKGLYLVFKGKILVENPQQNITYTVSEGEIAGITAFIGRRTYAVNALILEDVELIFLPDI
jgi:CRP-like cAMP-binding protein